MAGPPVPGGPALSLRLWFGWLAAGRRWRETGWRGARMTWGPWLWAEAAGALARARQHRQAKAIARSLARPETARHDTALWQFFAALRTRLSEAAWQAWSQQPGRTGRS